jgi:hypothetical protein
VTEEATFHTPSPASRTVSGNAFALLFGGFQWFKL